MVNIMRPQQTISADQICFGLNRKLDESSLSCLLQLMGRPGFADLLASRLTSDEINEMVTYFTQLMKNHLSKEEYHTLFLHGEAPPPSAKSK